VFAAMPAGVNAKLGVGPARALSDKLVLDSVGSGCVAAIWVVQDAVLITAAMTITCHPMNWLDLESLRTDGLALG
jgi:hypothetical protein